MYFIAREGEILLEIARLLQSRLSMGAGTSLRYLYGSRGAWQLPAHATHDGGRADWVFRDAQESSLQELLARGGLEVDHHVRQLAGLGAAGATETEPLRHHARRVTSRLAADPVVAERLRVSAAHRLDGALGYLRQELATDTDGPALFVDTGWIGRQMASLHRLLKFVDPGLEPGYLLYGLVRPGEVPPRTRTFAIDVRREPTAEAEGARLGELIEVFCSGSEGTTAGYERRDGSVWPVLAAPRNDPAFTWGLEEYRSALTAFVERFTDAAAGQALGTADFEAAVPALEELTRTLWEHPTHEEAQVWGSFPRSDYGADGSVPLARQLEWSDLPSWVLNRTWVRWPQASAELAPSFRGAAIRALAWVLHRAVQLRGVLRRTSRHQDEGIDDG